MTVPINNYNSLLAAQMYPASNNPFKGKGDVGKSPRVPSEGVQGVNPYAPAGPAQRAEAYEGQGVVSAIAQNKAAMAKVGLGGNPHPTETTGNRLMATEYDLF